MMGLRKIWKYENVPKETKIRVVEALAFPVVLYGCESRKRVTGAKETATEKGECTRRLVVEVHAKDLMDKKEDQRLDHANVNSCRMLEARAVRLALQYTSWRRHHSMEKDLLTGMTNGKRKWGRPNKSYWEWMRSITGSNAAHFSLEGARKGRVD